MVRTPNIKQAHSLAPWRQQRQIIGMVLAAVVFLVLVAYSYLDISARSTAVGRRMMDMENAIEVMQQTNEDLKSQLAVATSSKVMEARAGSMGFKSISTDEALYVLVPDYTIRQPVHLAPEPAPVELAKSSALPLEYTESLYEWFLRQSLRPLLNLVKGIQP